VSGRQVLGLTIHILKYSRTWTSYSGSIVETILNLKANRVLAGSPGRNCLYQGNGPLQQVEIKDAALRSQLHLLMFTVRVLLYNQGRCGLEY
jgi:hypothetical protein